MDFEKKRKEMVDHQIKSRGIHHQAVLDAFLKVPRHLFVQQPYQIFSYEDHPLPIGFDQTISQPYIVALMTDLLDIKNTDRILEIGTGSGYQTAILSLLAKEVFTLENVYNLQEHAKKILDNLNYQNIHYFNRNGFMGLFEHAPFDKIIVTAAPNEIPQTLINQLKISGLMVIPVGNTIFQSLFLIRKTQEGYQKTFICGCRFVEMKP